MSNQQIRTFGDAVRTLREERGLSLRGLGEAAGLNASSLSRLENGETRPSADTVHRLAVALDTDETRLKGYASGELLPNFAPYLRAKYALSDEQVAELEAAFRAVTKKPRGRS